MPHHDSLVAIAVVGLAALLCGLAMERLRQPALVGYILAGVLLGPSALGLVGDRDLVALFAEIGVLMLLFLIGMELPLASFLKVWRMALACMALQIIGALCFAFALSALLGWTREGAIAMGFIVALSSTAVAIKILEAIGEMESDTGRLTLAVLIAQDLAVVPMMLIVRDLSRDGFSAVGLVQVALAVAFLVTFLVFLHRRGGIRLPVVERIAGNPDLRAIAALALCLGAAAASGLLGLSPAYGAFLAGILIGNTEQSKAMIHSAQPIQSLFMMIFFLSVGLLIDLGFIWDNLGQVLAWLLLVTLFKTALNIGALRVIGNPWDRSFLAGVVMGQIGEFSFVLVATAAAAGLIAPDGYRLTVAVIALSLMISPLWLATARRLVPIVALSITSFREIVRLLLGRETLEMAARSRLAALTAAKAAAGGVPPRAARRHPQRHPQNHPQQIRRRPLRPAIAACRPTRIAAQLAVSGCRPLDDRRPGRDPGSMGRQGRPRRRIFLQGRERGCRISGSRPPWAAGSPASTRRAAGRSPARWSPRPW